MRTEALTAVVGCATLLSAGTARAEGWLDHFEFGLAPEITLVGLAGGARAQVHWRPGGPRTVSRLLLAPGVLIGPEFDYVPVALGYRAIFRAGSIVRPMVGAGLEYQHRWVDDAPAARQLAFYLEFGSLFAVAPQWNVGIAAGMDVTFVGGMGFGLLGRAIVTWSPAPSR
jgi:hypothetical protein